MKICDKCGAYNSDDKQFCVDCSEKLGDAISKREEAAIKNKLNKELDKWSDKSEGFYVSIYDKILGGISIAGIVFLIVLAVMGRFSGYTESLILSAVCFAAAAFVSLFPAFAWEVEKFSLSFLIRNSENADPSEYYIWRRKVLPTVMTALGYLFAVLTAFYM